MATPSRPPAHSPGRGRTPSPKRNPAPAPPNPMRCPSPAPKAVSTGDVLPSDQQGWLTDQLRGRKVWCAVADMLFCVFEAPDSKVSKQVGHLLGVLEKPDSKGVVHFLGVFEAPDSKVSKQVGHLLDVFEKPDSKGVVHF